MPTDLDRKLTIKQLKLISVLGQALSMSRAAELLHVSPPALSRSLTQMEQALGLVLFERTTRSMKLTPAGQSLLRYANLILGQLDQAQEELEGLRYGSSGKISIGVIPAFSPTLVGKAVRKLQSSMPGVKIDIQTEEANPLSQCLADGTIDIMLSHAEFSADMDALEIHELYQEESSIICDPNHPLTKKAKVTINDVVSSPWILPRTETPLRKVLNRTIFVDRPQVTGSLSDIETDRYLQSLALLHDSSMLTVIPRSQAITYEKLGIIKRLHAPVKLLKGPMCSITLKKLQLSEPTHRLLELLQTFSKEME
ncbi:LysR family transcriptional regulator [Marinobacterium sp. YM272]|uniref:LysR family transcriptional regulator n=1 Tax=Marinobacterium sp. YM272 TaxID=3421654 RepID=UPI003D7F50C8